MIISKPIHVATNGIISFFFLAEKYSTIYRHHIFFIHSLVNGHLSCFLVLATVNSAIHLYLCMYAFGLHRLSIAECWLFLLAAGRGFSCIGAQALGVRASVVVTLGLGCPIVGGVFWDQGWNPCPLLWQADSYPTVLPGKSACSYF